MNSQSIRNWGVYLSVRYKSYKTLAVLIGKSPVRSCLLVFFHSPTPFLFNYFRIFICRSTVSCHALFYHCSCWRCIFFFSFFFLYPLLTSQENMFVYIFENNSGYRSGHVFRNRFSYSAPLCLDHQFNTFFLLPGSLPFLSCWILLIFNSFKIFLSAFYFVHTRSLPFSFVE